MDEYIYIYERMSVCVFVCLYVYNYIYIYMYDGRRGVALGLLFSHV